MEKLAPGTKVLVGSHEAVIVKYLAEGGFAHIYTVETTPKPDANELCCLKRVVVKTKPELNLLRKEVDTMQRLAESRYVVRLYDSNAQKLENGTYEVLLLMEYCPNKSLLDFMNLHLKTKLRPDQITKIMYQITIGLSSMHEMHLIHRDLKIENVLIDSEGNFKLADFGSTCSFMSPPKNQEEFKYIAQDIIQNTTPQYRAPEMIDLYRGQPIDDKSDIWALGVFLYKLMYYTTPFETQGELAILHGYFQFPDLPKYPSRLKNLVIIMLQVNPMLRPNVYQVLCEICDMIKKPVPIKDSIGLGPYDFEAYAKYQQQIQLQQQQQMQMQQQYMQQKYLENQQKQQQAQPQVPTKTPAQLQPQLHQPSQQAAAAGNVIQEPKLHNEDTYDSIRPQELTRSSNPSVGDLRAFEADEQASSEIEDVLNNSNEKDDGDEEKEEDDDNKEEPDLENVEKRFPELEELDIKSAENKFPEIEGIQSDSNTSAYTSPSSRVDTLNISEKSRNITRTPSSAASYHTDNEDKEETPSKLGLKLTHTDAWKQPPADQQQQSQQYELDGVFHRSEPSTKESSREPPTTRIISNTNDHQSPQVQQPQPQQQQQQSIDRKKDTFQELFDFESPSPSQIQTAQNTSSRITSMSDNSKRGSRNPFPTSKNPFPTASNTGGQNQNPWADYQPKLQHYSSQPVQIPQYKPNQQQMYQPQVQMSYKQQMYQTPVQYPTSSLKSNSNHYDSKVDSSLSKQYQIDCQKTSPSITLLSPEAKLIDLDSNISKETRPKFNLDLLELEISDDKKNEERRRRSRNNGDKYNYKRGDNNDDDDDENDKEEEGFDSSDSNGELKVEEMKVSRSNSQKDVKKSNEINKIDKKLKELDLKEEEEVLESDDDDEEEDRRHSRRSLSLKRPIKKSSSRSRSKESRPRSFLGF